MDLDAWISFQTELRALHPGPFFASRQDFERFATFVQQVPVSERIPLLLHAYDQYRSLSVCGDERATNRFESSCWSILISTILCSRIKPDQAQACAILRKSYHQCGHGSDVEPPLTLAEHAFQGQAYSEELFDSVRAYRETLRSSRGAHAANVKRKLSWILWHDVRATKRSCFTRRIQESIHAMDSEDAFQWQWLLRNTAAGLNSAPGKSWVAEGQTRLALIGEARFVSALEAWFKFPGEEVTVSPEGSAVLRLLVWYGALVDPERSLPVLVRLARVSWSKRSPINRTFAVLAWLIRTHGNQRFEAEARLICESRANPSVEVQRLDSLYFPQEAEIRQRAAEAAQRESLIDFKQQADASRELLRALFPLIFGANGAVPLPFAAEDSVASST